MTWRPQAAGVKVASEWLHQPPLSVDVEQASHGSPATAAQELLFVIPGCGVGFRDWGGGAAESGSTLS